MNNKTLISQPTPIPIETCLSLDDAKKDSTYFNRYHFDLPGEWNTSSNNERIVGIRNIYLLKSRRRLEYRIELRKYFKSAFQDRCKNYLENELHWTSDQISKFSYSNPPDDIREEVIKRMRSGEVIEVQINMKSWLPIDRDLRKIYDDFIPAAQSQIETYNATLETKPTPENPNPVQLYDPRLRFEISTDDPEDRDLQMDGYYESNRFIEEFYSPRNEISDDPFYVDIRILHMNDDCMQVFNISNDNDISSNSWRSIQNQYFRRIELKNVWDRHTCKVFSSLASQSNKNYIGHTDIQFNPIKYFVIKSTDTKFYVEFYAGRNPKTPIKLPDGESFFIELQLMRYQKLLYI